MTYKAATEGIDTGRKNPILASMTTLLAAEHGNRVVSDAVQVVGGARFTL